MRIPSRYMIVIIIINYVTLQPVNSLLTLYILYACIYVHVCTCKLYNSSFNKYKGRRLRSIIAS